MTGSEPRFGGEKFERGGEEEGDKEGEGEGEAFACAENEQRLQV